MEFTLQDDVCDDSSQKNNYIEKLVIPDPLPKIKYVPYLNKLRKKAFLYITYPGHKNEYELNKFNKFKEEILNTTTRFTYPLVFIIYPSTIAKSKHNIITREHMRNLQIWANQIRYSVNDSTNEETDYLVFILLNKCVEYLNEDADVTSIHA